MPVSGSPLNLAISSSGSGSALTPSLRGRLAGDGGEQARSGADRRGGRDRRDHLGGTQRAARGTRLGPGDEDDPGQVRGGRSEPSGRARRGGPDATAEGARRLGER